jgi:hypothetical protein
LTIIPNSDKYTHIKRILWLLGENILTARMVGFLLMLQGTTLTATAQPILVTAVGYQKYMLAPPTG